MSALVVDKWRHGFAVAEDGEGEARGRGTLKMLLVGRTSRQAITGDRTSTRLIDARIADVHTGFTAVSHLQDRELQDSKRVGYSH